MTPLTPPPHSPIDLVTEMLHGVAITDPYRWLEEGDSPDTRKWLVAQQQYARSYLDSIPQRPRMQERLRELLDVETCDSFLMAGSRCVFRKRFAGSEQPCICLREASHNEDQILLDPKDRGTGKYTSVKPLRISPDGQLMLYEVKEGGERSGTFELQDIQTRKILPDRLPRGYLRGFAFTPGARSFYYVHDEVDVQPATHTVRLHVLGTSLRDDRQVFAVAHDGNTRLHIIPGDKTLGLLVSCFGSTPRTALYIFTIGDDSPPVILVESGEYKLGPILVGDRILAITDREAPNSRIVELRQREGREPEFLDIVAASDFPIRDWAVTATQIYVAYTRGVKSDILAFDHSGTRLGSVTIDDSDSVRMVAHSPATDDLMIERESFTRPIEVSKYSPQTDKFVLWRQRDVPFESNNYTDMQVWFSAKDGERIPMFLVGRPDVLAGGAHPTIMTSYGAFGLPMTPQFSVFVAFLMELGCMFALPNIRGGSEFGAKWHDVVRGRNHQVAIDDFLAAAEWLIGEGHTRPEKLGIFGGSNSGLLVGAAMTQRPDLFQAVLCIVPLLDMLRYHLFDSAFVWQDEYGTSEDPEDFTALHGYSPYHRIRKGSAYPATMLVSGDADGTCNSLHARKMTARLQSATSSGRPIILDYSHMRGHSPVLPLSHRVAALTDRMAFFCDQLGLTV